MAGHSQFKNIMYRKGAQDAKRAKIFTKIIRELTVSAKTGVPDPATNPRLRAAMAAARDANMPKDTMERAIKRGAGGLDGAVYEEVRYEGYGPGGVAVIVEALTDNRNRTASDIRTTFSKAGGNMGESNSVAFMFQRKGVLRFLPTAGSPEALFEAALEAGAENVESDESGHEVTTEPENFGAARSVLEAKFGRPELAKLAWVAQTTQPISGDTAEAMLKLIDALEDNDDVQNVSANYEIPEAELQRLSA
jgi:YebC/PmpR family DNA-binding regulatory protein